MNSYESKVYNQISILRSHLRGMIKKASQSKNSFESLINKYKLSSQYDKAFDSFNGFCSQYENERALNHLFECTEVIITNLHELISFKALPMKYEYQLSIICFSQSILHIPNLDFFVIEVVQKLWGKQAVENLKFSPKIPDSMIHIVPRDRFTLEELHFFASNFTKDLNMDFNWFFKNFPINAQNEPEKTSQVRVLGKNIFMKKVEPPQQKVTEYKGDAAVLPILPPFKKDSYMQLNQFVEDSLQKWNTWKFVV